MREKHRDRFKNPFLDYFLGSALVCCIVLTILFSCINVSNARTSQIQLYQSKVNLLIDDWNSQIELLEDISLKIRINPKYQPFYLYNNYQEKLLLDDFRQYSNYSMLTNECFLYYRGDDKIFHSSGYVIDLNVYMQNTFPEEQQRITQAVNELSESTIIMRGPSLLVMLLMEFDVRNETADAVLVFKIDNPTLNNRFQMVAGGLIGTISLYQNDTLLFCNQAVACSAGEKGVLSAISGNGTYTICYLPKESMMLLPSLSPFQFLALIIIISIIVLVSIFFAKKTYQPVQNIAEKYKTIELSNDKVPDYRNALEEIDCRLNDIQHSNHSLTQQLSENQKMLRRQLLHELLQGKINYDLHPYLEKVEVKLPGPYYYVISIQFEEMKDKDEFMEELQAEIEALTSENDDIFVYTLVNRDNFRINAVCSIRDELQEKQLTEYICEIVNNASYSAAFGLGNPYRDLHKISASWLESIDNIHNAFKNTDSNGQVGDNWAESILSSEKRQRFFFYLSDGNKDLAYTEFHNYITLLEGREMSFLIQQYMFTSFLSEFGKVAAGKGVSMDNRNLALILSARKVSAFKEAVLEMLEEYFGKLSVVQEAEKQGTLCEICDYLDSHFMEYDISVERIADHFKTDTAEIRQAIVSRTGCKYKERLIALRIELAKKLLLTSSVPIAEVCDQVGYGNVSYFVTLFKKQTGMSPGEYRNYHKIT